MAIRHTAETVGYAFTSQYYQVLDLRPEDTHKFYKDSSVAGWEGNDGVVYSVTTMKVSIYLRIPSKWYLIYWF